MIKKRIFGKTENGDEVIEYIIDNGRLQLHCLNYGCIINKLIVSDKNGVPLDVVLGFESVADYARHSGSYMGAAVGRVANRIQNAEFLLNGKKYELDKNDGENCLHGGFSGLSQKIFKAEEIENGVSFSAFSPDGEGGFSGNATFIITYKLLNDSLSIEYECLSDKDTPVSLTNHSYFNLSGEESICEHLLFVNADYITPTDDKLIPTGEFMSVSNTPFDFNKEQKVGLYVDYPNVQIKNAGGYDHNYVLKNNGEFKKVASLSAKDSGICMNVYTDAPGMQVYSGNFLSGETGKYGKVYKKRAAICLETQGLPNAVNRAEFPSVIQKAGKKYTYKTTYEFTLR